MNESYVYLKNLSEQVPVIPGNSILSQVLVKNDQVEVTLFQFARGQELSEHTSAFPAIVHILSGDGSMTLGPDHVEIHAGSWVYMPPDLPHSLHTDTPMTMLLTLSK
jgi:quercetin dioxygenase-like cupin family protein